MIELLPFIIAIECLGAGYWHFEPYAPYTSRAVESGWGEPRNGLSILATTDADTVDVGATVRVEIFLRFDPFHSDGRVGILHADRIREQLSLVIRDRADSTVYTRHPSRWGMRSIRREVIELKYGDVGSRAESFYLLVPIERQVPVGDYLVHVTYANPGEDSSRTREGPFLAPGVVWAGTVETADFPLHVRAKAADTTRCALPTRVALKKGTGQLMWQWDRTSFEPTVLISRPGYHLASETTVSYSVDSTSAIGPIALPTVAPVVNAPLWRYQLLEGLPKPSTSWSMATGPCFCVPLSGDLKVRFLFHVTIFETPWPDGYSGGGGGVNRVLRDYDIVASWP